jgi:hypothetical protein
LAYHLLQSVEGDKWEKIPAIMGDGNNSVWRQASENTARAQLNAIGLSRQLALLIMDARKDIDGQKYDDFEVMVLDGECDRRYYAQVANGNIHRIPEGMAERIYSAMNLSKKRVADYRSLLKLTDDDAVNDVLWVRADVEGWSDLALREIRTLPLGNVKGVIEREAWGLDDLRGLVEKKPPTPLTPLPPLLQGARGQEPTVRVIETEFEDGDLVTVAWGNSQYDEVTFRPIMNQVKDHEICRFIEAITFVDDEGRVKGGALARVWRHTQKSSGFDEYAVVGLNRLRKSFTEPIEEHFSLPPEELRGASVRRVQVVDDDEPSGLPPRVAPPSSPAHPMVNERQERHLSEVDDEPNEITREDYSGKMLDSNTRGFNKGMAVIVDYPCDYLVNRGKNGFIKYGKIGKGEIGEFIATYDILKTTVDKLHGKREQYGTYGLIKWQGMELAVPLSLISLKRGQTEVERPTQPQAKLYFVDGEPEWEYLQALKLIADAMHNYQLKSLIDKALMMSEDTAKKMAGERLHALFSDIYMAVQTSQNEWLGMLEQRFMTIENEASDD